jgi:SEC-C motif-containing protein
VLDPCPCGSAVGYHLCCGPLHHGERYSAFALGDADYLFRTWHPRTRPADTAVDADVVWISLEVTDTAAGGIDDDRGEVEFTARFVSEGRTDAMHERSRFERRRGRWVYVDGDVR